MIDFSQIIFALFRLFIIFLEKCDTPPEKYHDFSTQQYSG